MLKSFELINEDITKTFDALNKSFDTQNETNDIQNYNNDTQTGSFETQNERNDTKIKYLNFERIFLKSRFKKLGFSALQGVSKSDFFRHFSPVPK